jgi:HK97 family phage prohead protease
MSQKNNHSGEGDKGKILEKKSMDNKMEKRFFSSPSIEVRKNEATENNVNLLTGYASVFYNGTPETEFKMWNDEEMYEQIDKNAFDESIQKDDIRGLFNHDPNFLLGRNKAGTLRLSVDEKGLKYEIDLPDTQAGRDVAESVKRGDISGASFAFVAEETLWIESGEKTIRAIKKAKLYDVSPVTYAAYSGATASFRDAGKSETAKEYAEYLNSKNLQADLDFANSHLTSRKIGLK